MATLCWLGRCRFGRCWLSGCSVGSWLIAASLLCGCGSSGEGATANGNAGAPGNSGNGSGSGNGGNGGSNANGSAGESSSGNAGSPSAAGTNSGGSANPSGGNGNTAGHGNGPDLIVTPDAGVGDLEPLPGQYGTRANLLAPNSEFGAGQIGGKIYVVGGYPSTRVVQDTVQVYDATLDEWDITTFLPVAVHHPMVTSVNDLLYVIGGEIGDGSGPAIAEVWVYDPAGLEWSERAAMPTARSSGAAAVIDQSIYVVGGRPPAGNAFEVYDVANDEWTELAKPSLDYNERNHLIAAAIAGKIYVAGGRYDGGGFSSPMTDALEVFDPALGEWAPLAPMPRPRGGVNGVVANGCFHVFGGEGSNIGEPNDVFPDHDVYDPGSNTWTSLPPLPTPVHGVTGAAFIDGLIYIPGGGTMSGGNSGSLFHQVFRVNTSCE